MKEAIRALKMFIVMTILLGGVYPLVVTALGQIFFPHQVGGSLIEQGGKVIGSELIAQKFMSDRYFWARPSANDYNPLPSGGTNLGPTSKKLQESVVASRSKLGSSAPQDLIFSSASGLDPHISSSAAKFQIDRVAAARGFDKTKKMALAELVTARILPRQLGFLGDERVNVLELNLALDRM